LPRQNYVDNGITYTIAPDDEPAIGRRTWALVEGAVTDELTTYTPLVPLSVDSPNLGVTPRVADGGIVGLAGIPVDAFSTLKTTPSFVDLTISASGYIPVSIHQTIAAIGTFPDDFDTTPLPLIALHRVPIAITGQVAVSSGVTSLPSVGATVTVTGIWRTLPAANAVVPPVAPDFVSLLPAIYIARAKTTTKIRQQPLTQILIADKHLLLDAQADDDIVKISDCVGLAVNDVIAIDAADPYRTEYLTIKAIFQASTPIQPARIQLTIPLQATHRFNAIVRKVTVGAAGASTPLADDAIVGDVCAFVGGVATLQPATTVSIDDGVNPIEYHAVSYFTATTVAGGFYRLPPLSRVAQLNLQANNGTLSPVLTFVPDYAGEENKFDITY
jgi:hypothetical protein